MPCVFTAQPAAEEGKRNGFHGKGARFRKHCSRGICRDAVNCGLDPGEKAPILEYDAPENRERLSRAEKLAAEKNCTVSRIGLAWLLHQPQELYPLTAPTSKEHIEEAAKATELRLTEKECEWLAVL